MKLFGKLTLILALAIIALSTTTGLSQDDAAELQAPAVTCAEIAVPEGHKLQRVVYAIGVQIYRWNGSAWAGVAPDAKLYSDPGHHGKIGSHYGGPTWEADNGGKVVAAKIADCSPDPGSVAWLLLGAVENEGPGVFGRTTFIQRVNTVAGIPPQRAGLYTGEEVRMPYTTEYLFYTAKPGRK